MPTKTKAAAPPITETTPIPDSKVTKSTKASKTSKTVAAKETPTPVVAPVAPVEVAPVEVATDLENAVVSGESDVSIYANFTEFIGKFQSMMTQFNSLKTELKSLERKTIKQLKVVERMQQKKKRKAARAPSGFVKPSLISNELADFLGKPQGSEMARTDVTREINKYIRANNLQDKDNGRKINPDKQLSQLLKIEGEVVLTYFNLQRYMGPHFPKQAKSEVSASTTTA